MPDSPDLSQRLLAQLRFPCGDVPEPGDIKNVAPGIYWLRMPLPFQLNHINLWLIEEETGWTIVDTGINTQDTRDLWEKIFAQKLKGKPVTRVIATHLHPDHVGLAGWIAALAADPGRVRYDAVALSRNWSADRTAEMMAGVFEEVARR